MAAEALAVDHELRRKLNDEIHARPAGKVPTPARITYLAHLNPADGSADADGILAALLEETGSGPPPKGAKHVFEQFGNVRLRFERHTEFCRYAFLKSVTSQTPFAESPLEDIPAAWLERVKGNLFIAVQLYVIETPPEGADIDLLSEWYFGGNTLVGAMLADGRGIALSDFRIHDDGFSRMLVFNEAMQDAQVGRIVQRLLEIETYRMMALLALPLAQELLPKLDRSERELAAINDALMGSKPDEERDLLERLTKIAASNQSWHAASDFRFSASNAYYDLVLQRIRELREERIPGIQTFMELTTRRLTPAIKTCRTVASRQQSIVSRLARSTQLLSTRIDVERQSQNQSILASVNRRLHSQLRLQATVEGISVAAVTYYVVGLFGIVAKGMEARGWPVEPGVVSAVSVPLVAAMTWYVVRSIRRRIDEEEIE